MRVPYIAAVQRLLSSLQGMAASQDSRKPKPSITLDLTMPGDAGVRNDL